MAGLPITIPLPGESAIASYDWSELALNIAYKTLYCCLLKTGAAVNSYVMTTSNDIISNGTSGAIVLTDGTISGPNGALDLNFLFVINKPLLIRGDLILTVPFGGYNQSGSNSTLFSTMTVTLYHGEGVTDTQMGTANATASVYVSNNGTNFSNLSFSIPLTPKNFGVGTYLKLRVQLGAMGSSKYGILLHDPANRSSTYNSKLAVSIPIKADI